MKNKIKQNEISLQKQIVQWLNLNHCFVWRTNVGLFFKEYKGKKYAFKSGLKGMADIIGIKSGGQFLAIEVKTGWGKPTQFQIDFLQHIRELGGDAFVAWSLNDVIARLEIP